MGVLKWEGYAPTIHLLHFAMLFGKIFYFHQNKYSLGEKDGDRGKEGGPSR